MAPQLPLRAAPGTGRPGAATLDYSNERELADADRERRHRLNQRLRQAFIEGAEEHSRRRLGRGLTAEELEQVLLRYPERREAERPA